MPRQREQPIPVTRQLIEAAQRMWESLSGWQRTDEVLANAHQAFPSNTDFNSVLLKASLLDRLYATNVFHLWLAAEQVVRVFSKQPCPIRQDLVVEIALVSVGNRTLNLVSFASKYAHFFHDNNLPLTDSYAMFALTRHLGEPKARAEAWTADYRLYCAKIEELKQLSGVSAEARAMDHYLWLAGNWVAFRESGHKARINKELKACFEDRDMELGISETFSHLLK